VKLKKKIGTAVASVALVGAGSMAFAFWSSTGSGDGTATTGTASSVTIVQDSTITGLGPGVAAQSLDGHFSVTSPVHVGQVTVDKITTNKAGCDASNFSTENPDATNAEVSDGALWGGGSIVFVDKAATNQDVCQGATVTISYVSN